MDVFSKKFINNKIGVLGLGLSGVSAVKYLKSIGKEVYAWDDSAKVRNNNDCLEINIVDLSLKNYLKNIDILLVSPGVPLSNNIIVIAKKLGKFITSDIEIFWQKESVEKNNFIAVSGSNGKSTVSSIIYHIMKFSGLSVKLGGNIGIPVLDLVSFKKKGTYVLELSSYQLELISKFKASISILTNISPDHIDRHGSLKNYIVAKEKIFKNQSMDDIFIINLDNDLCRLLYEKLSKRNNHPKIFSISLKKRIQNSVYFDKDILIDFTGEKELEIGRIEDLTLLKGDHNKENIACAVAACLLNNVSHQNIKDGLSSFKNLPNRMDEVTTYKNITFINDSKSTNIISSIAAIKCYKKVIWIAGGQDKNENLEQLLHVNKHILAGFFIGTSGEKFKKYFEKYFLSKNSIYLKNAMNDAITCALRLKHPVAILFSPGCASFDQFKNFEVRGEIFISEVKKLKNRYLE